MRRKHGDINHDTGMVFWSYDSDGRERWMDPARFLFRRNCAASTRKRLYWKDLDLSRAKLRAYHHANKEMKAESFSKWSAKNKKRIADNRLRREYGITADKYDEMLLAQNGLCAICQKPQIAPLASGQRRQLCVDHCHKTGDVRKLLCVKCNTGIGQFNDNPELLIQAALYLKAHTAPAQMGGMQTQGLNA